jgi:cyclophilin family peptidyl-prolyl cis-trans isomerase
VALARRSRDQAVIAMPRFSHHVIWQVRMYAARAAAILEDVQTLDKLAYDASDNVREAALGPLRKLRKEDAEPAILAALQRPDYQLVRTAATLLQETGPDPKLARPLVDALKRVTLEGKDTSRDIRVALLEAIEIHAGPDYTSELEPLLRDFDPVIAGRVAGLLTKWTSKPRTAEPLTRPHADGAIGVVPRACLSVRLRKGNIFRMEMDVNAAPLAARHFVQLALKDHYYDGLSFHRVVPNFVIQGGSPGANEYAGQKDFMRDEVSALNEVGSVGLSTRGRNTGDAQFFVNLVTNTRLDYDYTIFAHVFPRDMRVVYDVEEGDEIAAISQVDCEPK